MTTPVEYIKQKAEKKERKEVEITKQLLPLLDAYQIEDKEAAKKIYDLWGEMGAPNPLCIGNHKLEMVGGLPVIGGGSSTSWFVIDGYKPDCYDYNVPKEETHPYRIGSIIAIIVIGIGILINLGV